ncbi:MAG: sigma-70 family RNA polymerase sigma factor [Flavitalea sp.]
MNHISDNNASDRHLVNSVLSGNSHAFSAIIKNTEALVAQIVYKMIDNAEDRRDLAQDVYLKVYSNLRNFRFQSKLSTWIAQIAYNACVSHLQKKKPELPGFGDSTDEEEKTQNLKSGLSSGTNVESELSRKERIAILSNAIEKLPPLYKTLITLFHNEQMSYEEIGEITGLSAGTLKSYLFRARAALKTNLLQKYKKEEL